MALTERLPSALRRGRPAAHHRRRRPPAVKPAPAGVCVKLTWSGGLQTDAEGIRRPPLRPPPRASRARRSMRRPATVPLFLSSGPVPRSLEGRPAPGAAPPAPSARRGAPTSAGDAPSALQLFISSSLQLFDLRPPPGKTTRIEERRRRIRHVVALPGRHEAAPAERLRPVHAAGICLIGERPPPLRCTWPGAFLRPRSPPSRARAWLTTPFGHLPARTPERPVTLPPACLLRGAGRQTASRGRHDGRALVSLGFLRAGIAMGPHA